jgi:hypothetical protein
LPTYAITRMAMVSHVSSSIAGKPGGISESGGSMRWGRDSPKTQHIYDASGN